MPRSKEKEPEPKKLHSLKNDLQHPSPNAVQHVESEDKASQTQNPVDQQEGLRQNTEGSAPQAVPHPDQAAGQHATGSYAGGGSAQDREKH